METISKELLQYIVITLGDAIKAKQHTVDRFTKSLKKDFLNTINWGMREAVEKKHQVEILTEIKNQFDSFGEKETTIDFMIEKLNYLIEFFTKELLSGQFNLSSTSQASNFSALQRGLAIGRVVSLLDEFKKYAEHKERKHEV